MRALLLLVAVPLIACSSGPDPWVCTDDAWAPGACTEGEELFAENTSRVHIDYELEITYDVDPPSSGDHRPHWAQWGEYEFLPAEHWLHNLEHGGVALLYHPCAADETVDALRAYAQARADDDGGAFRWVLTPYPDLPTAIAVVAWEWTYSGECVDEDEIEAFVAAHYRQAPEDIASDGSYSTRWIGR